MRKKMERDVGYAGCMLIVNEFVHCEILKYEHTCRDEQLKSWRIMNWLALHRKNNCNENFKNQQCYIFLPRKIVIISQAKCGSIED